MIVTAHLVRKVDHRQIQDHRKRVVEAAEAGVKATLRAIAVPVLVMTKPIVGGHRLHLLMTRRRILRRKGTIPNNPILEKRLARAEATRTQKTVVGARAARQSPTVPTTILASVSTRRRVHQKIQHRLAHRSTPACSRVA
jgi:hypothetical protein